MTNQKLNFTFFFAIILFFFPVSDILETEKEFIAAAQKASRKQVLLFASFLSFRSSLSGWKRGVYGTTIPSLCSEKAAKQQHGKEE